MSESERAFFVGAAAGLLPALFIAAILQREGIKQRDQAHPRSEASVWTTFWFSVAIFFMLAGELAAFHALRTDRVRDQDYAFVAAASSLLVATIVGRIMRQRPGPTASCTSRSAQSSMRLSCSGSSSCSQAARERSRSLVDVERDSQRRKLDNRTVDDRA
jgi:hypothetical protein